MTLGGDHGDAYDGGDDFVVMTTIVIVMTPKLFIYSSIYLFIYLSIYLLFIYLS